VRKYRPLGAPVSVCLDAVRATPSRVICTPFWAPMWLPRSHRMPGLNGIEATHAIVGDGHPATRVIMLTTFDMDEYVYDALLAGASGFLLKDLPPEQLVQGIRAVCRGESLLSPAITRRMIETFIARPRASVATPDARLGLLTPANTKC
jgi:DNA-binding NarL/FixJ family response regulator